MAKRDFRLLFSAQVISLLGSGVTTVGLALFAYKLTGGVSATAVIGNALTTLNPGFLSLFSQPAGVIADRVSRKKILIAADLVRFLLLALFPFITAVWQVYALIFAINAVTAFFTPTSNRASLKSSVENTTSKLSRFRGSPLMLKLSGRARADGPLGGASWVAMGLLV